MEGESAVGNARTYQGLDVAALGERIREHRVRCGFSLEEPAERSGVSRSMLSAVE
jgi:hypothetical protein